MTEAINIMPTSGSGDMSGAVSLAALGLKDTGDSSNGKAPPSDGAFLFVSDDRILRT
jgi:hypothetical protein